MQPCLTSFFYEPFQSGIPPPAQAHKFSFLWYLAKRYIGRISEYTKLGSFFFAADSNYRVLLIISGCGLMNSGLAC